MIDGIQPVVGSTKQPGNPSLVFVRKSHGKQPVPTI
jgi:hypothetical protein